ncbi:hypothetical protein D1871_01535 [Nakamurella silvestris]|nr:hypothetical protein D1871_01535 [Nakamurella silvestris]
MQRSEASAILGVPADASSAQVNAAYKTRSRLLHPDRFAQANPADYAAATEEQARVNAARDVLLGPDRGQPGQAAGSAQTRQYSAAALRAARPHFAAAEKLQDRARQLNRMATWVGAPSLVIFVLSLFAHGAVPPFARTILIVSVFGSFLAAGRARSRQASAVRRIQQGQQILDRDGRG